HLAQALQAQPSGGKGIALAPSITTSTSHSGVQNAPATVPSNTNTPPSGGHIQLQGTHGGTTTGLPSGFSNQTEDTRLKSDSLPQLSACVMPGRDGVKPFIGEGFNLPTPAVSSLFGIHIAMNVEEDSASGASVVAIDNKIEQAMDLVKSHLMYAVREEVEVLKEHIKELYERNSVLERENAVLKSLANSEQLGQLSSQLTQSSSSTSPLLQQQHPPVTNNTTTPLSQLEGSQSVHHQPNITSA
uniref:TSC22 domain family, member 2 n=1 Tax=Mola mola TaxID=94237 RepID=A0A3Q3WAW2_MOLML